MALKIFLKKGRFHSGFALAPKARLFRRTATSAALCVVSLVPPTPCWLRPHQYHHPKAAASRTTSLLIKVQKIPSPDEEETYQRAK